MSTRTSSGVSVGMERLIQLSSVLTKTPNFVGAAQRSPGDRLRATATRQASVSMTATVSAGDPRHDRAKLLVENTVRREDVRKTQSKSAASTQRDIASPA